MFNDYTETDLPKNMLEGLGANHLTSMISLGLAFHSKGDMAEINIKSVSPIPIEGTTVVREFFKGSCLVVFSLKNTSTVFGAVAVSEEATSRMRSDMEELFKHSRVKLMSNTKFRFEDGREDCESNFTVEIPTENLSVVAFKINFRDPYTTPDDYVVTKDLGVQLGLGEFDDPRDKKVPSKN